jgi:hypothetical protein
MNRFLWLFLIIFVSISSACKDGTSISEDDAVDVISAYLLNNPEFKTGTFRFGEIRFRGNRDQEELEKYRQLEKKGLVKMTLDEQKKVFLSRDSSYVYLVSLTAQAAPLVLDQGKDRATVKMMNYVPDGNKPVSFVRANDRTARVTISLKKVETDFYPFMNQRDNQSEFITKTFKLRFKKDIGWVID